MNFLQNNYFRWPLLLLLIASLGTNAWPCAPAPRNGQFVTINEEAAVIVWDAKTKTEHFIRMASFSGAEDFGFLVPTPTKPELAEAQYAMDTVSELIRPKYVHTPHFDGFDFTPFVLMPFLLGEEMRTGAVAGGVRICSCGPKTHPLRLDGRSGPRQHSYATSDLDVLRADLGCSG